MKRKNETATNGPAEAAEFNHYGGSHGWPNSFLGSQRHLCSKPALLSRGVKGKESGVCREAGSAVAVCPED